MVEISGSFYAEIFVGGIYFEMYTWAYLSVGEKLLKLLRKV